MKQMKNQSDDQVQGKPKVVEESTCGIVLTHGHNNVTSMVMVMMTC